MISFASLPRLSHRCTPMRGFFSSRCPASFSEVSVSKRSAPLRLRAYIAYWRAFATKPQPLPFLKQRQRHRIGVDTRARLGQRLLSTTEAMAADSVSKSELSEVLTPRILEEVHEFWFQHLEQEELFVLPGWEHSKRWFTKDVGFDKACVSRFRHVLEAIRGSNATATDILAVAKPSSPLDWLHLVLLLDQFPRNCYRGAESAVAFNVFDPLALDIALRAIEAGIPSRSPLVRYRLAYRFWFYLPLMHSEDPAVHVTSMREHEGMATDIQALLSDDSQQKTSSHDPDLTEDELKYRDILMKQKEAAEAFCALNLGFEKRHQDIILRFGRYPHRNEALGRTPTAEETEYLDNGGETFA